MTAPTIVEIMEGIEDRLQTISGLRTSFYTADQINPPFAVVGVPDIDNYRITMANGFMNVMPTVHILVSASLDRIGQMALAAYADPLGAGSIRTAIEGDRTLGGKVDDCVVESFRALGSEEVGILGYYGGVFQLRVIAQGK